ncbi:GIY-YIG nuclease family protein [Candidatus Parcubacteria bacterium]|nr:MAG: GIY-YIG nuclease family protein [Candidatus Parcubacteria bacterium]
MFYVYMLRSKKNGQLYTGSTNDLRRRLVEHNLGKSFHTRKYLPYELIYYEAYKSETDARNRESSLKLRANALNQLKRRLVESLKTH